MSIYYKDGSRLLSVSLHYFIPVLTPKQHSYLIMLHQSEINKAKSIIKQAYTSESEKHWTTKDDLRQVAQVIHAAEKHLRLTALNTQAVVDAIGNAVVKGIITQSAEKFIMELLNAQFMANVPIVENEFIKTKK